MLPIDVKSETINWLLDGDVAIQYQVYRDLLNTERPDLKKRIETEGWGARFLSFRHKDGHWGRAFYQPKWTSSHYTLLDLKHLAIYSQNQVIRDSIKLILQKNVAADGGVNPAVTISQSDVCVNGMFLNYACYFQMPQEELISIINFVIQQHMHDGGFNCRLNRSGAKHSSLHSTISTLEGILEYKNNSYTYRLEELENIAEQAHEFILLHRLYRSHRTGHIIDRRMLMLSYPPRWYYDILRALDYFQAAGLEYDPRMEEALKVLLGKRRKDQKWPVQNRHLGKTHFEMEKTGGPSRWNTLRALRVFKHFGFHQ